MAMSSIQKIDRDLGRVEGKLDAFISQMAVQDDRTTTLATRVDKVEDRQHYWAGAGTLLGAMIGWFAQFKGGG